MRSGESRAVRPDAWGFQGAFAGRRVLVTGHTGFKGTWLCEWLVRLGANVAGYSLDPPTDPSLFAYLAAEQEVVHLHGDVRDFASLSRAFAEFEPELVFHLAAQPLVRESYVDPVGTFETNVLGCVALLECVRKSPCARAVLVVTSDKCYENQERQEPYTEEDALGGGDPYSSSKACQDLVTTSYRKSFFGPQSATVVASARAGNVIGGGDWAVDRLIPDCVRALEQGLPIRLRNPRARRPWQHVLDCLSGYLALAEKMLDVGHEYEGPWNFGPDTAEGLAVEEIVAMFVDAWGRRQSTVVESVGPELPEARLLALDSSKARGRLGWSPAWGMGEAVLRTAGWYRAWAEWATDEERGRGLRRRTLDDIAAYIESARMLGLAWAVDGPELAGHTQGLSTRHE